jgi:asparagine synthase (glutamine-hydrolysing)
VAKPAPHVRWFSAGATALGVVHQGVPTARAELEHGDVIVFLVGEIHGYGSDDPAARFLEQYLEDGPRSVRNVHGSFAIVVWDGRTGRVFVLTDPLNSRAMFHAHRNGEAWIASTRAFPDLPYTGMDRVSVAQYMVNGIPLSNRTLLEGVRILDQASIHCFTAHAHKQDRYWRFQLSQSRVSRGELARRMYESLIVAVQRRVSGEDSPFLSLSGGDDAPAILCALDHLGVRDVTCFTYHHANEPEDGDLAVARDLARSFGYPHVAIPACLASVDQVLEDNITLGRGLTRLAVETDAWRSVGELTGRASTPTILFGEEAYGTPVPDLRSLDEMLTYIVGRRRVGRLSTAIAPEVVERWERDIQADMAALVAQLPEGAHFLDLKDVLYQEQRVARRLAWRENFAGEFAQPRLPLLDRDILELMQDVTTEDRNNKTLFKEVLKARFPAAFAAPRASSGSQVLVSRWANRVVREERERIRDLIARQHSPFDEEVPPQALLRMLRRAANPLRAHQVHYRAKRRIRTLLGRLTGSPATGDLKPIPGSLLLVRALFLREFFRDRHNRQQKDRAGLRIRAEALSSNEA